jgi:A/G-specific adenine glycosylase
MYTFPTLQDLADAPKELLLRHRSWLWFNSRALRLQVCARQLIENHEGILPRDRETLLQLPGIGPYTSCSLLAFTYNLPAPVIDTNIRRIFIHELHLPESITIKELEIIALEAIPDWRSNDRHNALMDYGSQVLTSKKTGIKPVSKQSRFVWSRRQIRGKVLKHLLTHWPTAITTLEHLYPHDAFTEIIEQMKHEHLLNENKSILSI